MNFNKKIDKKINNIIKKKGVLPPAIKITLKKRLKKIVNKKKYFLISILEKKNRNKIIGNNFIRKDPNINSDPKKLETVARIISNPSTFFPVINCK